MEESPYYLCIRVKTRSNGDLDDITLQRALIKTFESLGGITRAIVHLDVIRIERQAADVAGGLFDAHIRLHKEYVLHDSTSEIYMQDRLTSAVLMISFDSDSKFVKAALPAYVGSENSAIRGLSLVSEGTTPSSKPGPEVRATQVVRRMRTSSESKIVMTLTISLLVVDFRVIPQIHP